MLRKSFFNVLVGGSGRVGIGSGDVDDLADEFLLFNTATGAFARMDAEHAKAYEDARWDELPMFEGDLTSAGFITELGPEQEKERLHQAFIEGEKDHTELTLALVPTYACNYRCPYCYEQGVTSIKGKMGEDVMSAVLAFIEARYAEHLFERLSIQWYGGDPSLALDVVENLSSRMLAWCSEHGVDYDALILTNCNNIDEHSVEMLARSGVSIALLTIDGFEETHNKRRVAANGDSSFERVIGAARLFAQHRIAVNATMNIDKVNWSQFYSFRDYLRAELGIELSMSRLSDCGHFYGTRDFKLPDFDLLDPEDYAALCYEDLERTVHEPGAMRGILAAPARFCNGQKEDYYVIDCKGDVYACDGFVGRCGHARFNILEDASSEDRVFITHDPYDNDECSACKILPICLGSCDWERKTDVNQCHPLKYELEHYLRHYRTCLDVDGDDGFELLVPA